MKLSKAVNVTKHDIRENLLTTEYQLYTSRIINDDRRIINDDRRKYGGNTKDFGVQYDYKRNNIFCTCRNVSGLRRHQEIRFVNGLAKHIYAYHGLRSFTDIGVGSVKAFYRRKVKRIYLPEMDDRGVGSSDLSSLYKRTTKSYRGRSYYGHKKTSSKCVGGLLEDTVDILSENLSPIIRTKSGTTSPRISVAIELKNNVEIGNNTREKDLTTTSTQADDNKDNIVRTVEINVKQEKEMKHAAKVNKSHEVLAVITTGKENKISKRAQEAERVFSSESLVQHVHNLENPSKDKQSPISSDVIENKLEREYRKMFYTKSKDSKDQKIQEEKTEPSLRSNSILRRRFEALRRGISKKEESKRNVVVANNELSSASRPSRRDVSIVSDPPSLEERSYSNTKFYDSKIASNSKDIYKKTYMRESNDSDYQGAKGMFKLWGKRFNLEEDYAYNSPNGSMEISKQSPVEKEELKMPTDDSISKKEGKKFFFFKRKSKDKTKSAYKQKKGVTAGRCEVGDGLTIKIGAANPNPRQTAESNHAVKPIPEEHGEMLRKTWLQQFLSQTIEPRNSVKIRWNNNAYATSSSTVFEIMENVYKDTGVVFRSNSDITTGESSYYKSFTKQRVNFMRDIEAWMVPKFIPDLKNLPLSSEEQDERNDNIKVRISNQKWFIYKSKAFAHKIEVVLHSKNVTKYLTDSKSEYLTIDIPKGFFTDFSSDSGGPLHTSNEEVYKIVEYESPESQTRLIGNKTNEMGDHLKDIKVTVSVKNSCDLESKILEKVIKTPAVLRDVAIQVSDVFLPKRCNVIGVGIITQKDVKKREPILKTQDEYSDDDSEPSLKMTHIKGKFADSYLQDYYRHWIPLGIDYSWCGSDSHIEGCSENVHTMVNNEGDGAKSCPNIYDDFQTAIISSCGTSCCSQCSPREDVRPGMVTKIYSKFKTKGKSDPNYKGTEWRVLPKDSHEVFKKRKIYAQSNKSNWLTEEERPYSVPSIESKGAQDTLIDCTKLRTGCCKPIERKKKKCNKHVSLPDCDALDTLAKRLHSASPSGILTFKGNSKCDFCNKSDTNCSKSATVVAKPTCAIEPARHPCQEPPSSPTAPPFIKEINKKTSPLLKLYIKQVGSSCNSAPNSHIHGLSSSTHLVPSKCKKPVMKTEGSGPDYEQFITPTKTASANSLPSCTSSASSTRSSSSATSPPPCLKKSPLCPPTSLKKKKVKTPSCIRPPPCPPSPPCAPIPTKKKRSRPYVTKVPLSQNESPCYPPPPCEELSPRRKSPEPCCPTAASAPTQTSKTSCSLQDFFPCFKKKSKTKKSKKSPKKLSPQCSPQSLRSPKTSKNKIKSPPKSPPCVKTTDKPPCKACRKRENGEFPWPLKNQNSNQPSISSLCSGSPLGSPKDSKTKKICSSKKPIVCKKPVRCPSPKCSLPPKISGIHLKIRPSTKTSSTRQCQAKEMCPAVQKNSDDNIVINIKKGTDSTEEIREGMNIKVQDADGKTLFERRDYTNSSVKEKIHSVLNDVYKNSHVHAVSTSRLDDDCNEAMEERSKTDMTETKSYNSVANLIEINFELKVTQGDKTTTINTENKKHDTKNQIGQTSHDVFLLKDEAEQCSEGTSDKNYINIKIIIKNKNQNKNKHHYDEYAQKISEKFQTVSTGYSDVLPGKNVDNIFSIHTTAVNIASSNEPSKTEILEKEKNATSNECIQRDPLKLAASSQSGTEKIVDRSKSKFEIASKNSNVLDIHNYVYKEDNAFTEKAENYSSVTDTDDQDIEHELNNTSDGPHINTSADLIKKVLIREEKKSLLKKVFEKASKLKKFRNKDKMKQIKEVLKVILTDSSDQATSRELVKEMTYASLKPNYFKDTDSMNNYYKMASSSVMSLKQKNRQEAVESYFNHPTENISKHAADDSDESFEEDTNSCLCRTVAAKLNMCLIDACCCKKSAKLDEETHCDLRIEEDSHLLNYNTIEFVNVETQNSKYCNNTSTSVQSRGVSGSFRNVKTREAKMDVIGIKREKLKIDKVNTRSVNDKKHREYKKLNTNTMLGMSDEDKVNLSNTKPTKESVKDFPINNKSLQKGKKTFTYENAADTLQCYETKKAVLEIYTEKKTPKNGEGFVAKLPKFLYDGESDIEKNYEEFVQSIYRNKVVMMSVKR